MRCDAMRAMNDFRREETNEETNERRDVRTNERTNERTNNPRFYVVVVVVVSRVSVAFSSFVSNLSLERSVGRSVDVVTWCVFLYVYIVYCIVMYVSRVCILILFVLYMW